MAKIYEKIILPNSLTFNFFQNNLLTLLILDPNRSGNTFELIFSIIVPGHNPIEVSDCGHGNFSRQSLDFFYTDLNENDFRFLFMMMTMRHQSSKLYMIA